jgi:hypothetical protein
MTSAASTIAARVCSAFVKPASPRARVIGPIVRNCGGQSPGWAIGLAEAARRRKRLAPREEEVPHVG